MGEKRRPNVILLVIDTLREEASPFRAERI